MESLLNILTLLLTIIFTMKNVTSVPTSMPRIMISFEVLKVHIISPVSYTHLDLFAYLFAIESVGYVESIRTVSAAHGASHCLINAS